METKTMQWYCPICKSREPIEISVIGSAPLQNWELEQMQQKMREAHSKLNPECRYRLQMLLPP